MRDLLRLLLRSMGVKTVHEAENGAMALKLLKERAIDIAICDLLMAEVDGNAFTREVRQSAAGSQRYLPIIMVTGHSERKVIESARDAGVTEFLRKPITARSLYLRLVEVVERPRPFIQCATYFGPDRRRKKCDDPSVYGSRRAEDRGEASEIVFLAEDA
ncbi:MAG: response regulator [Alphaproteobacteria bacterium]|nr:response regulator [Alphaproteobacteria bacterium]